MNRLKIFTALAAAALLTACSDDLMERPTLLGDPITVQNEIQQQYVTRASDGGFADGDQIGVFVVNYANGEPQPLKAAGNHADNVCFTYHAESNTWSSAPQLYWKDKQTHADAYGYYPYNASLKSVEACPFTLQTDQREAAAYEQSDFLWAKATNVAPGTPIHLKHQHIMAGIEVTLVEGEDFEPGEWYSLEKSVLIENTVTSATINLQNGIVTVGTEPEAKIITPLSCRAGGSWRAVTVPQTVAAEVPLIGITIGTMNYHFQRTEPMTFYPGKLHKFTIQADKLPAGDYQFTLISESITPWENDSESHNGSTKEYVIVNIEKEQYLGDIINEMGLDPTLITNLKLTGTMSAKDNWTKDEVNNEEKSNFKFLRTKMPKLEAINMENLFLVDGESDINISNDVIPHHAFFGIESLQSVVFPKTLKVISALAFQGTNLKYDCILPDGLLFIGEQAFGTMSDEGKYVGLSGLGQTQSHGCHMTGELYIPSSCRYIGDYAFARQDFNCELILPEEMDYLGHYAFGYCKYMTGYLHIPKNLKVVRCSWVGMSRLQGIAQIPEGVERIEGIGCPISSLHIPEGVTSIQNAFTNYSVELNYKDQLREVYFPSTLKQLGFNCFSNTGIQHLLLPDGIEIIPHSCFANCTDLQDTLILPKSLVTIEGVAFSNCAQLQSVVFPENLSSIGDYAFAQCYSLNYIQCLSVEPPRLGYGVFDGVEKNDITVVVPENAVDAYRNAPEWSEFKRISAYRNFVCRPMQDKLLNKGHTMTVVLNADDSWTMTHCPTWAHVDHTSGYKKTELQVSIDDLTHGAGNRNDSIVFTLSGKTNEDGSAITCYYKLSQYDYEHEEDSELTLQQATRGNGKVNIFICGDGYDARDIAEGVYLADMRQEMEYFFDVEPYRTYKDYFNVYTGFAMSRESGINSTNSWRETKFETLFGNGCKDVRMSAHYDAAMLYALQTSPQIAPDGNAAPLVILLANTDHYDGVTSMWADNSAVALCTKSTLEYPYDARGIIQHEAGGHGFGKLADEYIYHQAYIQSCKCSCCKHVPELLEMKSLGWARNLSLTGKYKDIEWRHLIFDSHYSDICDIYEGGYFHARGAYRSEVNSCMNNNVPYFSTMSRMAIVERIKQYAGETFSYDDFVANDSREYGNKFILTRGVSPTQGGGHGMHLSSPIIKQGSVLDLLKNKKK